MDRSFLEVLLAERSQSALAAGAGLSVVAPQPTPPESPAAGEEAAPRSPSDDGDAEIWELETSPMGATALGLGQSGVPTGEREATLEPPTAALLDVVPDALVRRMAWGGDGQRGTARLELGDAALGGVLTVSFDGRALTVDLELPSSLDGSRLEQRVRDRLAARGMAVDSVQVR